MRLPLPILSRLRRRLIWTASNRPPDVIIGGEADPYMKRWWIIPRNRFFNAYLHEFWRSDDDRALHDHPWINCSIVLWGQYTEHTIAAGGVNVRTPRLEGDVVLRRATAAHRVELTHGRCWTLFLTGPNVRTWGFHCRLGWVPWRKFTDAKGTGIGAGCGEYE